MRDLVYVVAVKRQDSKLPTGEKIAESRFFAEKIDAQKCADYYNNLKNDKDVKPYHVFAAILEVTHDPE